MHNELWIQGADAVSLFCRLNINGKKDLPLRASEIGLLIYTAKNAAPVRPGMAAEFFKVSKPMVAAMVASLTEKGYLVKTPSETDRRSFILTPTAKAAALVESVYEEYFKVMRLLWERMGNDRFAGMIALLEEANTILLEERNHG